MEHLAVEPRHRSLGSIAPMTAPLAPSQPAMSLFDLLLGGTIDARIGDLLTCGERGIGGDAHGLVARRMFSLLCQGK